MRIILSRKCVDADNGGIPSPIIDDHLCPLPIPSDDTLTYKDLKFRGKSLGKLVEDLSRNRLTRTTTIHLDPDLDRATYKRKLAWRPIFGQHGAADSHLQNRGLTAGDLFLFFGWFRRTELNGRAYRYVKGAPDLHVIFGWLQVGEIVSCRPHAAPKYPWTGYHPHVADPRGRLFISSERLVIDGQTHPTAGAGRFSQYDDRLRLTAPAAKKRGLWQLPAWCYPHNGSCPLTYHPRPDSYMSKGDYMHLQSTGRGQEFVLDTTKYREAIPWAVEIIRSAS